MLVPDPGQQSLFFGGSRRGSMRGSLRGSLRDSLRDSMRGSLRDSLRDSMRDSLFFLNGRFHFVAALHHHKNGELL
ncbi:MAG: hypothetical protein R6W31_16830 [Bacteroidales bacterium]